MINLIVKSKITKRSKIIELSENKITSENLNEILKAMNSVDDEYIHFNSDWEFVVQDVSKNYEMYKDLPIGKSCEDMYDVDVFGRKFYKKY